MATHRIILVIADSHNSDRTYEQQLQQDERFAYQTLTAQDNTQILNLAQSHSIDAILLDLQAISDSLTLLKQLQAQMSASSPPIVVIDEGNPDRIIQAFKNGAVDCLIKDRMTPDDLRAALRSAIAQAEATRAQQYRQSQFQISVENMLDCFGIFSAIRDAAGQIVDFRIEYLNGAACEYGQMPKTMQIHQGLCEVLPIHRQSGLFDAFCHLLETGKPLIKDFWFDGATNSQTERRAFDIRATKLNDGFVASWRDITDRKQVERALSQTVAALQASQKHRRDLAEAMPQMVWTADATGSVTYWNQRWYDYTHLTEEASLGVVGISQVHPEERDRTLQQWQHCVTQGNTFEIEHRIRRWDGVYHWFINRGIPTRNGQGQITGWIGTITDIDTQKQLELSLREKEQQLQQLSDSMPQFVWICDAAGQLEYVNQQWLEYSGLSLDDTRDHTRSATLYHPDDRQHVLEQWAIALRTQHPFEVEARLQQTNTQTYRWFLIRAVPSFNENGQVLRWFGTSTDITDRRQAEIALQQTTERLNVALKSAPLTLFNQDLELRYTWVHNPTQNFSVAEVMGQRDVDLVSPETAARLTQLKQHVLHTGEGLREEVKVEKDGEVIYYDLTIEPLWNDQHSIVGITCAAVDISERTKLEAERKQAEDALRESEELKQRILESSSDCIKVLNLEGQILYMNAGGLSIIEADDPAPILATNWISFWSEEKEQAIAAIAAAKAGNTGRFQGCCPTLTGKPKWWDVIVTPLRDGSGQVVKLVVVSRDITEQKQAEVILRESEERFRNMADNAPVMIWVTDSTGYCTYLSQSWYEFTGQTQATGLGFGWLDVVHPNDQETARAIFLKALAHQESFRLEYRLRRRDGTYCWAIDAASPWFGTDGQLKGYIGSVIDISDRKQAEAAVRESEERYRTLFESIDEGFCVIEVLFDENNRPIDYRFLETNPAFEKQTGLKAPQGKCIRELVPNHEQYWFDIYGEIVLTGQPNRFEERAEALHRWYDVYAFRIGQPESYKVAVLFSDISDRKQADQEREQLLAQEQAARATAERANRIKDEFLAVLSHELRSPLNPILGWTKLLQKRKLDETKTAEALASIERNARLQTQLIDDLLDVAKILRGKLSLDITFVNLPFVVEAAIDTVRTAALAKGIALHSVLPQVSPISGDAARLQQIVWNLLSNAIKFTPKGGRVEVKLEQITGTPIAGLPQYSYSTSEGDGTSYVQLTITDTGKGIRADFLPYIFDSFRQEDASITRKYGGLGLGLAIVRQLVEAHGGTIAAHSQGEGLGATFTVRFPSPPLELEQPQPAELLNPSLDLTGIKVLAVDDDPDARELLSVLLTQYGAEVVTAASAPLALDALASTNPNILVSDIGMPDMDGYSLIQQIRALPPEKGGRIPAIALTAYAREDDHQRAITSGYQQHMTKPLEPEQLVQAVLALLHRPHQAPINP